MQVELDNRTHTIFCMDNITPRPIAARIFYRCKILESKSRMYNDDNTQTLQQILQMFQSTNYIDQSPFTRSSIRFFDGQTMRYLQKQ